MSSHIHKHWLGVAFAATAGIAGLVLGFRDFGDLSGEPGWETPLAAAMVLAAPASRTAFPPDLSSSGAAPRSDSDVRSLFRFVQPPDAAALDAALPAPALATRYVKIDAGWLEGKASPFWQPPGEGRFALPLPEGGEIVIVIDASEMLGARRFSSSGHVEGRPFSRAIFSWNEGFLNGSVEGPDLGTYALRTATAELTQFYRVEADQIAPCGGVRTPAIDPLVLLEAAARRRRGASAGTGAIGDSPTPGTAAAANLQRADVHLMIAHTPSVFSMMTGAARTAALQSAFDAAVARINSIFEASLITARVSLVRIQETPYDEGASAKDEVQDDALTALQNATDGRMDEVLAIRDQAGADVVCLVLGVQDSRSSGLSFILATPGDNTNPLFAFSVVEYFNIAGANVLAHELGHLFGCAHDRENSGSPGSYAYSYGYRFFGADGRRYHDIMSYPPGTELSYFSNPNVILPAPVDASIGVAPGLPGESSTALTIEKNAFEVATYRLQTQAAPNRGTLINVATRAFVGTGEQVLIAGFVVAGSQAKRVLLRGAGPALAQFGIVGALANPLLHIFRQDAPEPVAIATNEYWELQSAPGEAVQVVAASEGAGAFAFSGGSADAAVLVKLASGAYTAVVEGANGATGFGLVEAYEVDRDFTRIINLATRGYADNQGKEMIAGFVVEGAVGATKRILIRVRGPTLGRAPFSMSGVLEDPMMEIFNGVGERLIQNDDWSVAARFVGGQRDDFQPLVRYYGEQQLAATGLEPANRREPGVLVDLPPGAYTVVVKPFELRSSDPAEDQPARPGVGIVEVYEIDP